MGQDNSLLSSVWPVGWVSGFNPQPDIKEIIKEALREVLEETNQTNRFSYTKDEFDRLTTEFLKEKVKP
jgi:hypothetical protein